MTLPVDFVKGFVRDVCDDGVSLLELALDLLPVELSFLEEPIEFGMQKLLDVMEFVDG